MSKDEKRAKQEEYSRQLQLDNQSYKQDGGSRNHRPPPRQEVGIGGDIGHIGELIPEYY